MKWNLYENGKFLEPLMFSNGKTQEDIVKEVLNSIEKGHKIIFIRGMCGTGKSAIALNIAKEVGKASIVVPIKNLQEQYKRDYENKKHILKDNKEKLKISVITGRNNHKCKFLEDNKNSIPKIKKEINSNLHDIFEEKREKVEKESEKDISADNPEIPCKIEIKEKNIQKIKQYLKKNKKVKLNDFDKISDIKRIPVASICPYWSPVLSEDFNSKYLDNVKKRKYLGLSGKEFTFYKRTPGCKFYEQFNSYLDSDVIIFNSLKYELEFLMDRKPSTEVEIVDECDKFLDGLSNQRTININRLQSSISNIPHSKEEYFETAKEITEILNQIKKNFGKNIRKEEIIPLKRTGIYDLIRILIKKRDFLEDVDEENYLFDLEKTSLMFKDFIDETYVIFDKKDENIFANLVTTNLSKKFKIFSEKNKNLILMSGTIHSEKVLKEVFGIKNFEVIEAESQEQGQIKIKKTGLEKDCRYSKFSEGEIKREEYLRALDKSVEISKKPSIVHVNSFKDLPDKHELKKLKLKNLVDRESLLENQKQDKKGKLVQEFKEGKEKVLFSTKISRGVDFPKEECNSIIFTKYPNPNVKGAFWKILSKTHPLHYWPFYRDKAKRELLQKVYRGLRSKEDKIELLSPDIRVIEAFEKQINKD